MLMFRKGFLITERVGETDIKVNCEGFIIWRAYVR